MKLFINTHPIECNLDDITLSFTSTIFGEFTQGYSTGIDIPMTPQNLDIFGVGTQIGLIYDIDLAKIYTGYLLLNNLTKKEIEVTINELNYEAKTLAINIIYAFVPRGTIEELKKPIVDNPTLVNYSPNYTVGDILRENPITYFSSYGGRPAVEGLEVRCINRGGRWMVGQTKPLGVPYGCAHYLQQPLLCSFRVLGVPAFDDFNLFFILENFELPQQPKGDTFNDLLEPVIFSSHGDLKLWGMNHDTHTWEVFNTDLPGYRCKEDIVLYRDSVPIYAFNQDGNDTIVWIFGQINPTIPVNEKGGIALLGGEWWEPTAGEDPHYTHQMGLIFGQPQSLPLKTFEVGDYIFLKKGEYFLGIEYRPNSENPKNEWGACTVTGKQYQGATGEPPDDTDAERIKPSIVLDTSERFGIGFEWLGPAYINRKKWASDTDPTLAPRAAGHANLRVWRNIARGNTYTPNEFNAKLAPPDKLPEKQQWRKVTATETWFSLYKALPQISKLELLKLVNIFHKTWFLEDTANPSKVGRFFPVENIKPVTIGTYDTPYGQSTYIEYAQTSSLCQQNENLYLELNNKQIDEVKKIKINYNFAQNVTAPGATPMIPGGLPVYAHAGAGYFENKDGQLVFSKDDNVYRILALPAEDAGGALPTAGAPVIFNNLIDFSKFYEFECEFDEVAFFSLKSGAVINAYGVNYIIHEANWQNGIAKLITFKFNGEVTN